MRRPRMFDRAGLRRKGWVPAGGGGVAMSNASFAFLSRNAQPATAFYGIPPERVMEIGIQIEL